MALRLEAVTEFETVKCVCCGIEYAAPLYFVHDKMDNGGSIYCPNGHCASWTETTVKRLSRQLIQERAAHDQTKAAKVASEKDVESMKKRASLGKCPCCDGVFRNLRNHMHRKHPEFAKTK